MSWRYSSDIIHRKLKYVETLASEDGINISMDKWINFLQDIQLEISFETIYRTLLDLHLMILAGFDWTDFDFPPLPSDFILQNITEPPIEVVAKAKYDMTRYDISYYDPPDITFKDIERFAWNLRYKASEKDTLKYKKTSESLKNLIETYKDQLKNAGVSDKLLDVIEGSLSLVESRLLNGAYVGFSVVGLSKVGEPSPAEAKYDALVDTRTTDDWKTTVKTESILAWDNIVGWARVGYARVSTYDMIMNKTVSDEIVNRINEFWKRSGLVPAGKLSIYGGPDYYAITTEELQTLWQRIFMLQRVDQYHYHGGTQQLKMQYNIKNIKPILDKHGVISNMRSMYYNFAHELCYASHDSHRLYKKWRKLVAEEDIIQKYIRMGCDEHILREIVGMVKK